MDSTLDFYIKKTGAKLADIAVHSSSSDSRYQTIKFRIAQNYCHHKSANQLLTKMYSWRGYETSRIQDTGKDKITIIAYSAEKTVGTLSINSDSNKGLLADELFPEELNILRNQGKRIGEYHSLAMEPGMKSRPLLASMFHIMYLYLHRILNNSDGVIEVNPRHANFYEKKLGFTRIGSEKTCLRVNAPAVLLLSDFSHVATQINKFGGMIEKSAADKSLFPYFFSKSEEDIILTHLRNNLI